MGRVLNAKIILRFLMKLSILVLLIFAVVFALPSHEQHGVAQIKKRNGQRKCKPRKKPTPPISNGDTGSSPPGESGSNGNSPASDDGSSNSPASNKAPSEGNSGKSSAYPEDGDDIPDFCEQKGCSGHLRIPEDGKALNYGTLRSIFDKLDFPSDEEMIQRLDAVNAFNAGQPDDRKRAGAYLAYSTVAKYILVPASGDEKADATTFGDLKIAGMQDDHDTIAKYVKDDKGLSQSELADLWGGNEHWNLHAVLFGNPTVWNAVHCTSLNDNAGDGTPKGKLGGYNDKGEFTQWGWGKASQELNGMLLSAY
jgi:hypothetical protein